MLPDRVSKTYIYLNFNLYYITSQISENLYIYSNNAITHVLPSLIISSINSTCKHYSVSLIRESAVDNHPPAGIPRKTDVTLTSMRNDEVSSTSIRRHAGTICPLGSFYGHAPRNFDACRYSYLRQNQYDLEPLIAFKLRMS